jgi:hypothetical protein
MRQLATRGRFHQTFFAKQKDADTQRAAIFLPVISSTFGLKHTTWMYACLQLKFAKFCAIFAKRRSTRKLENEGVE